MTSPRGTVPLFLLFLFTGGLCHAQGTQDGQAADQWSLKRRLVVAVQIESRGVKDQRVLEAMKKVERHTRLVEKGGDVGLVVRLVRDNSGIEIG